MTHDMFLRKRKKFFRGGNTKELRRPISLEEQAAESVGFNTWFSLTDRDREYLMAELLNDGVISAKLAAPIGYEDGGDVMEFSEFVLDYEEDGSVYVLGTNDAGKNQILAKLTPSGRVIYFIEEARNIPEVNELLLEMADNAFANGGITAEPAYVVKYKMADAPEFKEKEFSDKDKAELFWETLSEDSDVELLPLEERAPIKKMPEVKEKKKSLFAAAKPSVSTSAAKKKRERIQVDGIADEIRRYDELKAAINNAKAEQELIGGRLKEIGVERFLQMYEQRGVRPANFDLADNEENILLEVKDAYLKVEPEKAELLKQFDGLLEEKTIYKFNPEILEKEIEEGVTIGDVISTLIIKSTLIPEEDKDKLITAETTMRVPKGTIDRLMQYENPRAIFELVAPIIALK